MVYLFIFLRFIYYFYLFIYLFVCLFLAALSLSCGMRDLSLWHTGFSLVVACRFLFSICSVQAPGRVGSVVVTRVPEHVGSVVCGTWALVEACELSSRGARA